MIFGFLFFSGSGSLSCCLDAIWEGRVDKRMEEFSLFSPVDFFFTCLSE